MSRVAVVDGVVGVRGAVHPEHVETQWVGRVEASEAHQGGYAGHAEACRQLAQLLRRVAVDDSPAGVDQRTPALGKSGEELLALFLAQGVRVKVPHAAAIARDGQASLALEGALPVLHVLRDVHNHGTRPARSSDLERRSDRRLEAVGVGHQKDVLGHGAHDRRYGSFLERVRPDRGGGYLAAEDHDGN